MERKYKRKLLVIGVIFLLLGASAIICGSAYQANLNNQIVSSPYRSWADNFDTYTAGSALHGQGGWLGWDNTAAATAYVSNAQAHSSPNSLESKWFTTVASDIVQQFSGYNTGVWIFTAWLYVPSTMTGTQFFILMNTYTPGTTHNIQDWSLQVEFNAVSGYIRDFNNVAATLPLIENAWAEIRVEIDFDADIQTVFYDDTQFIQKSWKNGVSSGGAQNLACVDLYAGDTTSTSVYWDDLSLTPPTPPLSCDADGPYTGETGEVIQFNGSAEGGTPPYSWLWTFGDGDTSTDQNPTHIYTEAGVFLVNLTVTDSLATTASDETTATITTPPQPVIGIGAITGGLFKVNAIIQNTGPVAATNVSWSINLDGGLILLGKSSTGNITTIPASGGQVTISSKIIIGLGKPTITVTAGSASKDVTATVLLFFIKI